METAATPRIISVEKVGGAVVITFEDGKCAVCSAALLYTILPHAKAVDDCGLPDHD